MRQGYWEKREARIIDDCSHAPRGTAASDAPRPAEDAERQGMRYHAERGNDHADREQAHSHRICVNAGIASNRRTCRSVRAARGRDRLRSSRKNAGFTPFASAAHWIANKFAPTELRHPGIDDCSHAPRGNGASDAPRPAGDAERQGMHYHAERGNDHADREQVRSYRGCVIPALMIVPTLRVVTALQTLRVQPATQSVRGCITTQSVGTITRIANKRGATNAPPPAHAGPSAQRSSR
jgi:hypothetical protein